MERCAKVMYSEVVSVDPPFFSQGLFQMLATRSKQNQWLLLARYSQVLESYV